MATPLITLKLVDELDHLPAGTAVLPSWLSVVFDPVLRATYQTPWQGLLDQVVPGTVFGVLAPAFPSTYPTGTVYWQTPISGGLSVYQLTASAWVLRWSFANGGTPATAASFTATKGFTASCGAGLQGTGVYRQATQVSTVSQADADQLALAAATAAATAALVCTVVRVTYSSTQSFTASCPAGTTGSAVTQSGTASSTLSQADADAKALAGAKALATQQLTCALILVTPDAPYFYSQSVDTRLAMVSPPGGYQFADLDYRLNGGPALAVPATGAIPVGDAALTAGNLVCYVRAAAGRTQGLPALNTVNFPAYAAPVATYAATQTYTANCANGSTGNAVTKSSTKTSTVSVADATALALADATAQASAALVCVLVPGVNRPPVTTLDLSASAPVTGTQLTAYITASDPDGTVASVQLYDNETLVGSRTSAPWNIAWTPTGLGAHTVRLRATDNSQATTDNTRGFTLMAPAASGTPTFAQVLNPGDNVAAMTWTASVGVQLRYSNPVAASSALPGNHMAVFAPSGAQVAGFDYAAADEGHPCAVTIAGTTYYHNAAGGALLGFTNGSVTLAL